MVATIKLGNLYKHIKGGLLYGVNEIVLDATGYEKGAELSKKVLYTQLEDGEVCKKGTQFVRDIEDFLNNFELQK